MGVKVRQKNKGRGKPWWVFISHNGKRTSRMVGDKQAAEKVASLGNSALRTMNQFIHSSITPILGLIAQCRQHARNLPRAIIKLF